jgi:D-glycero-D-manno-heptose 1,7-bisphosphate phosphatase
MAQPAVFLDKDGTLIKDVPYNIDPAQIELVDGSTHSLKRLRAAGYRLVVVTNQSGVARGLFPETAMQGVRAQIETLLGLQLDGFYYCPHHPRGTLPAYAIECECRKPNPGMLLTAARDLDLDLAASWMVGDILNDVEAGHRAGCRAILIDNGNETEWIPGPHRQPDYTVGGLSEAADRILERIPKPVTGF